MLTPSQAADMRRLVIKFGDCVGADDPDRWFPPEPQWATGTIPGDVAARMAEYERTAATLCADCPVKAECLALALHEESSLPRSWIHGVRGGLAPWRRYQMRRYRRRVASREVA